MKISNYILIILICISTTLIAQEEKHPLEMKRGHISSQWKINNNIEAQVFLESGFPKIVINEVFLNKHLKKLNVDLLEAPDKMNVALCGWKEKHKVLYIIKDSLIINGEKLKIDALVVNFSKIKAWKNYDIIYPIVELSGMIEMNIKDGYMKKLSSAQHIAKDFNSFDFKVDKKTRGPYIEKSLRVYDSEGIKEELIGNYLLDLGAPNAFILDKNESKVKVFVEKTERMHLKDTTRINTKGKNELSIIMPKRIVFDKIEINESFVPAMKFIIATKSNNCVGCIGNAFFKKFIIIFDYDNNKFYYKPNSDKVKMLN